MSIKLFKVEETSGRVREYFEFAGRVGHVDDDIVRQHPIQYDVFTNAGDEPIPQEDTPIERILTKAEASSVVAQPGGIGIKGVIGLK